MKMTNRTYITVLLACLLLPLLVGCQLSFDVVPEDVNIEMSFVRDDSCSSLSYYTITAEPPYDRTLQANFDSSEPVVQDWFGMPEGEVDLDVRLHPTEGDAFQYDLSVDKSWGEQGLLSVSCDDESDIPVLQFDLMNLNAVFTVTDKCRTYSKVELFGQSGIDPENGNVIYQPWFAKQLNRQRVLYYRHDLPEDLPTIMVRVTELLSSTESKTHDFVFKLANVTLSGRVDFLLGCEEISGEAWVQLRYLDTVFNPGDVVAPDGDVDGDATDGDLPVDGDVDGDTDADVEVDGDSQPPDGDQPDGDQSDGDVVDGDQVDGDLDVPVDGDLEVDSACGTEEPIIQYQSLSAESVFNSEASSDGAQIYDTSDTEFSDGQYVRLDATEVGQQLAFDFTVDATWPYTLLLRLVGGSDWGEVSLFIDDRSLPLVLADGSGNSVIDLNIVGLDPNDQTRLSLKGFIPVCLQEGAHILYVRFVSTHSGGNTIGVDEIQLSAQ